MNPTNADSSCCLHDAYGKHCHHGRHASFCTSICDVHVEDPKSAPFSPAYVLSISNCHRHTARSFHTVSRQRTTPRYDRKIIFADMVSISPNSASWNPQAARPVAVAAARTARSSASGKAGASINKNRFCFSELSGRRKMEGSCRASSL